MAGGGALPKNVISSSGPYILQHRLDDVIVEGQGEYGAGGKVNHKQARVVSIELPLFCSKFGKLPLFVSITKNYHIKVGFRKKH